MCRHLLLIENHLVLEVSSLLLCLLCMLSSSLNVFDFYLLYKSVSIWTTSCFSVCLHAEAKVSDIILTAFETKVLDSSVLTKNIQCQEIPFCVLINDLFILEFRRRRLQCPWRYAHHHLKPPRFFLTAPRWSRRCLSPHSAWVPATRAHTHDLKCGEVSSITWAESFLSFWSI